MKLNLGFLFFFSFCRCRSRCRRRTLLNLIHVYRWWREGSESTISIGAQLNIPSAKVSTEGIYFCQPSNEVTFFYHRYTVYTLQKKYILHVIRVFLYRRVK